MDDDDDGDAVWDDDAWIDGGGDDDGNGNATRGWACFSSRCVLAVATTTSS